MDDDVATDSAATHGSRSTTRPRTVASTGATTIDDVTGQSVGSIAINGETAIVGTPPSADRSVGRASVFTCVEGVWTRQATLEPIDAGGQFGRAVALEDDLAMVGDEFGAGPAGDHRGTVTVFRRERAGWQQAARLSAPETHGTDFFGSDVAVSNEWLLAGATTADTGAGRRSGAVFAFVSGDDGMTLATTLAPPTEDVSEFGRSIALDEGIAVVGSQLGSVAGPSDDGAAFVYERRRGSWRPMGQLASDTEGREDGFGRAVAVAGETIAVGAPLAAIDGHGNAGVVSVFERRGGRWRRQARLARPSHRPDQQFGCDLALDGDRLLVGSEFGPGPVAFERNGRSWTRLGHGYADGTPSATGNRVALSGATAVIGNETGPGDQARTNATLAVFDQ